MSSFLEPYDISAERSNFFTRNNISSVETFVCSTYEQLGGSNSSNWLNKKGLLDFAERVRDFSQTDHFLRMNQFKKAAILAIYFLQHSPITVKINSISGTKLTKKSEHTNAIFAYFMIQIFLQSSTVSLPNGHSTPIPLEHRISLSAHSFLDIINIISDAGLRNSDGDVFDVMETNYCTYLTFILEQVTYRNNPRASYPCVF